MERNQQGNLKYFIYARKSSESEERQARSIEDQLSIIREMAKKSNLTVVSEFTESKTGRKPGRPVFNDMLKRIEAGEANAILAWHPDRLARNSVDGGQIMYLLDTGILATLTFANFWFDNTSQGKFNLNMAFAQSKYYTDNLSENIRRGIKAKLARGVYPNWAKRGYINHPKTREIVPDSSNAHLVKEMFEIYSKGNISLIELSRIMYKKGLSNYSNKALSISQVQRMLTDPFYYGVFIFNGEKYQGSHQSLITKTLFDQAQEVMANRGKPKTYKKAQKLFALRGFITCANCGCLITAETQKGHNYYHCTHGRHHFKCTEPFIREDRLAEQFRSILAQLDTPTDWLLNILNEIDKMENQGDNIFQESASKLDIELKQIQAKLAKLVDLYLEGELDRADYFARKGELLDRKVAILNAKQKLQNDRPNGRLELLRTPIKLVLELRNTNVGGDLKILRNYVTQVGSNFKLLNKSVLWDWTIPFGNLANSARFPDWRSVGNDLQTHLKSNMLNLNKSILPLHNPM